MIREDLLNTPLESGVRSLIVLAAVEPNKSDLRRLVIYDYLLVHSGDIDGGPASLHAPSPFRSGELIVRRDVVKNGLDLVFAKGLVLKTYEDNGIVYAASSIASAFLEYLECTYAKQAMQVADWISGQFGSLSDDELQTFALDNIGRWGAEFADEPFAEEEM